MTAALLNPQSPQDYPQPCPVMIDRCPVCARRAPGHLVTGGITVEFHLDGLGKRCVMVRRMYNPEALAS